MPETTPFTYWLSENSFSYRLVLDRLAALGVQYFMEGNRVKFTSDNSENPLCVFLDGKEFNVLTWEEIVGTISERVENPAADGGQTLSEHESKEIIEDMTHYVSRAGIPKKSGPFSGPRKS